MMTVKELLGLDKLKSIELAAGKAGAKRAVTGAVMLDNPEMVDWMREGELLLTTGYVLKENPDLQDDILDALIKNKASGLAIKTRRYFDEDVYKRQSMIRVLESMTVGTPMETTLQPKVSWVMALRLLPIPAPGSIPVSHICIVVLSLSILRAARESIMTATSGFTIEVTFSMRSAVSIPVTPVTDGLNPLTLALSLIHISTE